MIQVLYLQYTSNSCFVVPSTSQLLPTKSNRIICLNYFSILKPTRYVLFACFICLLDWLIYERGWDPEEMMEKVVFCKLMLKYLRTATVTGQLPIDRATDTTVDALLLSLNGIGRLSMIPKTRWWSLRRHPTNDRRGMGFLRIVHFIRRSLCPWLYRLCIPMMAAGVSIIDFSLAACDSSAALQSIIKCLFPMAWQSDERTDC